MAKKLDNKNSTDNSFFFIFLHGFNVLQNDRYLRLNVCKKALSNLFIINFAATKGRKNLILLKKMALIGYARVSKQEQNLDLQIQALKEYGCEQIFSEQISGADDDREEYQKMLNALRKGDRLICWKLDRLGRNTSDFCNLVEKTKELNIPIISLIDQISTASALGEAMSKIASIFAEMERNANRERTIAGLAAAKRRGVQLGRPRGMSAKTQSQWKQVLEMRQLGKSIPEIISLLPISRATIYRYLNKKPKS